MIEARASATSITIVIGAVVYLVVLMTVGFYSSRKIRTRADFMVAGRSLPLWLSVATVFATWFGSGTLIGAAGGGL